MEWQNQQGAAGNAVPWSDTREGLKRQDYPRTRQVKIFLNSDFWEKGND
ncbi:hypothetical protein ACKVCA_26375 (plasmid) [Escherichia coli]